MNEDNATQADVGRTLDGKVIDSRGNPVPKADVWLFREGGREGRTETDVSGRFTIGLGDAADPWPAGDYVLRVLPPEVSLDAEQTVAVPEAGCPAPQVVEVHSRRDVSALAGWVFLLALSALLVLASWGYLDIHGVTLEKLRARDTIGEVRTTALSEPLADALEVARAQVAGMIAAQEEAGAPDAADEAADAGETAAEDEDEADGEAPAEEGDEGADTEAGGEGEGETETAGEEGAETALQRAGVDDTLATAEEIFHRVEQSRAGRVDEGHLMLLSGLFAQANEALKADDAMRLETALEALVEQVETTRASFLWEENPGRLLEVMFWALLATLLRLIFSAGLYLYKGSFLRTAIPHHLAFLITVPVVAVIIALVLMVVRIDLGGPAGVLLDMSNVLVSIILGALIGLAPWRAWEFLRSLADRVFERLTRWAKGGDAGNGGENAGDEAA